MTSTLNPSQHSEKVALITGGAKRIGKAITQALHQSGYKVIIHFLDSSQAAESLCQELNQLRPESACTLQADLSQRQQVQELATEAEKHWSRIDLLVNNASRFYPTNLSNENEGENEQHWNDIINSNLKAPFFLSQYLAETLSINRGNIINIVDIYGSKPLKNHSIYSISKAGLNMLTQSLALELGPNIRVNGISPGAILWPEKEQDNEEQSELLNKTALKTIGTEKDISQTVLFLAEQAPYITGQILNVDGGRSINV